ncbi:MAG TPA: L,D-transpeptidase family protein, partial [Prosthecobacter sp.]|nr:L,D-transpeptidase family protein [Prosthecobacter sp.]
SGPCRRSACDLPHEHEERAPKTEEPAPVDDGSFWIGDGVSGKPKIRISLGEQKISYFKGGELVGQSPMSSGREGYKTVVGTFFISEKDEDHKSSLYGNYVDETGLVLKEDVDVRKDPKPPGAKFDGADMRWFMRIHKAIGMHEGYLPGFPASHGCIRLPSRMAEIFYKATPPGTEVEITH